MTQIIRIKKNKYVEVILEANNSEKVLMNRFALGIEAEILFFELFLLKKRLGADSPTGGNAKKN